MIIIECSYIGCNTLPQLNRVNIVEQSVLALLHFTALSPERNMRFSLQVDQKFRLLSGLCSWGIRNLKPCSVADQKFWILFFVFVGNQKFWILSCVSVGDQKFWILSCIFVGDQKFWILSCVYVGDQKFWILSCVFVGGQKFWILSCRFFGGSEILNHPSFCHGEPLQTRNFENRWFLFRGLNIRQTFK